MLTFANLCQLAVQRTVDSAELEVVLLLQAIVRDEDREIKIRELMRLADTAHLDLDAASAAVAAQVLTHCNTLQHTATHCNSLQHAATCCNTLQHAATRCHKYIATHRTHFCRTLPRSSGSNALRHTATHCDSRQHTATHCNTRQHTATHCNTLQHTVTHHNTLQHSATKSMSSASPTNTCSPRIKPPIRPSEKKLPITL